MIRTEKRQKRQNCKNLFGSYFIKGTQVQLMMFRIIDEIKYKYYNMQEYKTRVSPNVKKGEKITIIYKESL